MRIKTLFVLIPLFAGQVIHLSAETPTPVPTAVVPIATPIIAEIRSLSIGSTVPEPMIWSITPTPSPMPSPTPSAWIPDPQLPSVSLGPAATDQNAVDDSLNFFSPFSLEALYSSLMYENVDLRAKQYANRGIWMQGAGFAAVGNPIAAVGDTRAADVANPDQSITYTGAVHTAVLAKGAPSGVKLRATGLISLSISAVQWGMGGVLYNPDITAGDAPFLHPSDVSLDKAAWWGGLFRGTEGYMGISKTLGSVAPTTTGTGRYLGSPTEPLDARESATREDDIWALSPAVIKNFNIIRNIVTIDGGVNSSTNTPLAKIENAIGMRGGIVTRANNENTTRHPVGLRITFLLGGLVYSFIQPPNNLCDPTKKKYVDETTANEGVDDVAGIEIQPPNIPTNTGDDRVTINASTGVWLDDLMPGQAGGTPLQVARTVDTNLTIPSPLLAVEQETSIIARGDVNLGYLGSPLAKNFLANGFNHDLPSVYINDLLHLEPRSSPPHFIQQVTLAERVGVLYFDTSLNRLCMSMPFDNGPNNDGFNAAVVWLPLAIESYDESKHDSIEGGSHTSTAIPSTAETYLRPTIELASNTVCELGVLLRNFPLDHNVQIYWERPGYGYDLEGQTSWASYGAAQLISSSNSSPLVSIDRATVLAGTESIPNSIVQMMAIDTTTGEAAGLSFDRIPESLDMREQFEQYILGNSVPPTGPTPGGSDGLDVSDLYCSPPAGVSPGATYSELNPPSETEY